MKKFKELKSVEKAEYLNEKFFEIDGKLYHREIRGKRTYGTVGNCTGNGYILVGVQYKKEYAHRIIFAMTNGFWSENDIDHIDGDKTNNRPDNLQEASRACNGTKSCRAFGTSGVRGVHAYWGGWRTVVSFNSKSVYAPTRKEKIEAVWDWCSLIMQKLDWEHCEAPQLQRNFDLIEEDFNKL